MCVLCLYSCVVFASVLCGVCVHTRFVCVRASHQDFSALQKWVEGRYMEDKNREVYDKQHAAQIAAEQELYEVNCCRCITAQIDPTCGIQHERLKHTRIYVIIHTRALFPFTR